MANLLAKLRIDYQSLTMLQDITDKPREDTILLHNKILDGFMEGQNSEVFVSMHEYNQLLEKTNRQLRLREMLIEHSSDASLIVMSLPMPRQVNDGKTFHEFFITFTFSGHYFGAFVHVLAWYADDGHAATYSRPWKSLFGVNFLFLRCNFIRHPKTNSKNFFSLNRNNFVLILMNSSTNYSTQCKI